MAKPLIRIAELKQVIERNKFINDTKFVSAMEYRYVFLQCDSRLGIDQAGYLMDRAHDMYCQNKQELPLKTDWCEGTITTKSEVHTLGTFYGQKFDAKLETTKGTMRLCFLVHDCSLMHSIDDVVN